MAQMSEADFKKHIESGHLSGLYVLYGEEKYLVRRNAKKLIRKACADDPFPAFNFQRFDGAAPVDDIAAGCGGPSFYERAEMCGGNRPHAGFPSGCG